MLGHFGDGGLPQLALRGTNQPDLIGQPVGSGGLRLTNDVIEALAMAEGILGAPVVIYDSTYPETTLDRIRGRPPLPAATVRFSLEVDVPKIAFA